MNVIFDDNIAATCWHNLMRVPEHRDALMNWLLPFLCGAWVRYDEGDIPVRDPNEAVPKPDWRNNQGRMGELHLRVCSNDCYKGDDGWFAYEFSWGVYTYPVDGYGQMPDNRPRDREHCAIFGGLINHGTHDEPSWSSHT